MESSVGEILAGIALAGLLMISPDWVPRDGAIEGNVLLEHSVVLATGVLLLLAGIELKPSTITSHIKWGMSVAIAGIALPFVLGAGAVIVLLAPSADRVPLGLLAGLSLAITAVPAAIKILEEFGALASEVGSTIVVAALLDDIIGLILMALVLPIALSGQVPGAGPVAWLLVKVAIFYAVTIGLGNHVFHHVRRGLKAIDAAALELSVLILVACLYSILAEGLGLHWILGPFMAGLFFEPNKVGKTAYKETRRTIEVISAAALSPLFFASIGTHVDLASIGAAPLLLAALVAAAFIGKTLGCGGAARLSGLPRQDALAVGIGMSARGAVGIVILDIAYQAGVFPSGSGDPGADNLFSLLILTAVVTTAAVPPLLRWAMTAR